MVPTADVQLHLDNRIRLMSALLSATDWPEKIQARTPHGTHPHARATRKHVSAYRDHEAVRILQRLLDGNAPVEAMFALAARLSWPDLQPKHWPTWAPTEWPHCMRDFCETADLADFWRQEDPAWQKSMAEAGTLLAGAQIKTFLRPFLGEIDHVLLFMPNIGEPSDRDIGVRLGGQLAAIVPPRLAWGDSAPWPFDEDPVHVYRAALLQFGRLLLLNYLHKHASAVEEASKTPLPVTDAYRAKHPTWEAQFIDLFLAGVVALYLQELVNPAEAEAYVLMERKVHGMGMLPGVVSVLRRYRSEHQAGRYQEFAEFMPVFPKQLRVAKRIVNL